MTYRPPTQFFVCSLCRGSYHFPTQAYISPFIREPVCSECYKEVSSTGKRPSTLIVDEVENTDTKFEYANL